MSRIESVRNDAYGIECAIQDGLFGIRCVAPGIVRVRCTREASFANQPGDVCVEGERAIPADGIREDAEMVVIANGQLHITINKASGALTFEDDRGETLFGEPAECPRLFREIAIKEVRFDTQSAKHVETVDGGRVEAQIVETGKVTRAWTVQQHFEWSPDEALYGLGSHEEDVLNLRGTMQYLYQQNMKAVVPVLVSSKGYGILFDATCEMEFHDDEQGSYVELDAVQELDYYVIYGPEFDQIVAGYRALTGRAPMLPRWAFGYCQSKERYKDQEELVSVVEEYRRRKLPLDLIIQDWQYWPTGWGVKSFDETRYPDPTAMCARIHALNAHVMVSIWPSVRGEHPEPAAMKRQGFMLGNQIIYDAYNPAARGEYWRYADEGLFRHGIDAWWCDCTEPVEADWNGSVRLSAKQRRDININAARPLLGRERVNAYSLLHSKGIYENQRQATSAKRVLNLTRSAYAGQQRYGTVTWSGDVAARWEVLKQQIPCGLNFTATGCPYWTNDIGAFFTDKREQWFWNGAFPQGVDDLGYREFYVRWFQYGAFLPMFRSHGTDTPREVWQFGAPGEVFYDSLVKFLRLRYRLLPYIYSLAGMTTRSHYTIMRALAFDFRSDLNALDIKDQYMFGPAFMVCPVTRPMVYGTGSEALGRHRSDAGGIPA
jgi:alpha-D-xyloside xylohydrolase